MKKMIIIAVFFAAGTAIAQDIKSKDVPASVKNAFAKKYPESAKFKVNWEKEKGNFEANWGGKEGEDNSAVFTPAGVFVELVQHIEISQLPASVAPYIKAHYKGAKIKEAGKVTDAAGKHLFEAEIKGKDLLFDEKGNFVKED